jgi:hypothetical protein
MISRKNVVYNLNLLSQEHTWFKVVVWFIVLKNICGGSSHWVALDTSTHITKTKYFLLHPPARRRKRQ